MNTEKRTLGDLMTALLEKHPESRHDFTILLYMLAGSMARITELEEKLQEMELDRDCWKARY